MIGWAGTGRMGTVMAGRLLAADRPVMVWNRTTGKTGPLAGRGALVAASLAELARRCEVVFVMVSASADLEQVALGEGGLLRGTGRPDILIDCSTVSEETSAATSAPRPASGPVLPVVRFQTITGRPAASSRPAITVPIRPVPAHPIMCRRPAGQPR